MPKSFNRAKDFLLCGQYIYFPIDMDHLNARVIGLFTLLKQMGQTFCEFSESLLLEDRVMPFLQVFPFVLTLEVEASQACVVRDMHCLQCVSELRHFKKML